MGATTRRKSAAPRETARVVEIPGDWIVNALVPTVTALKGLVPTDVAKHSSWANFLVLHPARGRATVATPVAGAHMSFPAIADAPSFAIPYGSITALRREDWTQPLRFRIPTDTTRGRIQIEVSERTTISLPMRPVADIPEGGTLPPMPFPDDDLPTIVHQCYPNCAFVFETEVAKRNAQYRPLLAGLLLSGGMLVATDSRVAVLCRIGDADDSRPPQHVPASFAKLVATHSPQRTAVLRTPNLLWAQVHYTEVYDTYFWQALPAIEGNVAESVRSTIQSLCALVGAPASQAWLLPGDAMSDALAEIGGFATEEIVLRLRPHTPPELLAGEDTTAQARAVLPMDDPPEWPAVEYGYDAKMLAKITRSPHFKVGIMREVGTLLLSEEPSTDEPPITYILAAAVEK